MDLGLENGFLLSRHSVENNISSLTRIPAMLRRKKCSRFSSWLLSWAQPVVKFLENIWSTSRDHVNSYQLPHQFLLMRIINQATRGEVINTNESGPLNWINPLHWPRNVEMTLLTYRHNYLTCIASIEIFSPHNSFRNGSVLTASMLCSCMWHVWGVSSGALSSSWSKSLVLLE